VATATPRGTLAVHSLRTARGHAPRRAPAVAAGLEVSRRNTFQDLPGPTSPLRVASTCRSLSPVPSVAWPSPSSKLHTPGACERLGLSASTGWGVGFPLLMLLQFGHNIVTICSGVYLWMAMTVFAPSGFSLIPPKSLRSGQRGLKGRSSTSATRSKRMTVGRIFFSPSVAKRTVLAHRCSVDKMEDTLHRSQFRVCSIKNKSFN